jgi:hypothetical protein
MPTLFAILMISGGALLLGATILGAFVNGVWGAVGAPLLALFGWFYMVPIIAFVSAFWFLTSFRPALSVGAPRILLTIGAAIIGGAFMSFFGVKEQGRIFHDTVAYVTGGAVSGAAAVWCVTLFNQHRERETKNGTA